ncbi:hypothetical protein ECP03023084_5019 [Escherichia coli P0302308.4]|nr:hypothetical protein ECP03023084_5019 [Escherichia coli P0302308.4]
MAPQPLLKPLVTARRARRDGPAGEEIFWRTWSRAGEVQLGPL